MLANYDLANHRRWLHLVLVLELLSGFSWGKLITSAVLNILIWPELACKTSDPHERSANVLNDRCCPEPRTDPEELLDPEVIVCDSVFRVVKM
mmetsp:Transcript_31082/g.119675  ORF Transcript_31082/g.119675 Transcript_31082/m.119675 type:complete len:93 (+) Transcript_31082:2425-2703(+)